MTNEFKGTKGKFIINKSSNFSNRDNVMIGERKIFVIENHSAPDEEAEANANLISEAFNVVNETGYTPNQLAEQNKELLEALKLVLKSHEGNGEITGIEVMANVRTAIANAEKI